MLICESTGLAGVGLSLWLSYSHSPSVATVVLLPSHEGLAESDIPIPGRPVSQGCLQGFCSEGWGGTGLWLMPHLGHTTRATAAWLCRTEGCRALAGVTNFSMTTEAKQGQSCDCKSYEDASFQAQPLEASLAEVLPGNSSGGDSRGWCSGVPVTRAPQHHTLTMRCWKSQERMMLVACLGKTPRLFLDFLSSLSKREVRSRFTFRAQNN